MRERFENRDAGERGFILVGVVMFMLALTILGLSLFALSSFEAQFFGASVAREQSLQNAESGMELAKVLLSQTPSPQRLEAVRQAVGQFGVTSALAYQALSSLPDDTTSQGPMDWDKQVTLVISARSGGVERTFEASYRPGDNPYRRLLTAGTEIRVNTENSSSRSVLELHGGVWQPVQSVSDTAWTSDLTWPDGRPVKTNQSPRPLADAFVDAGLARDPPEAPHQFDEDGLSMDLINTGEVVKFFRSPPSPPSGHNDYDYYSFLARRRLTITIQGTVVWLVERGASFHDDVVIETTHNGRPATLVIVAKKNDREPGYENHGIWFKSGLTLNDPDARLFLVSEGDIGLTHRIEEHLNQNVLRLSVVAGGRIDLGGPDGGYHFRLFYDADDMDQLADQLLAAKALPPFPTGASTTFAPVRSTWAETTPP